VAKGPGRIAKEAVPGSRQHWDAQSGLRKGGHPCADTALTPRPIAGDKTPILGHLGHRTHILLGTAKKATNSAKGPAAAAEPKCSL
jgi:hypothetical protein